MKSSLVFTSLLLASFASAAPQVYPRGKGTSLSNGATRSSHASTSTSSMSRGSSTSTASKKSKSSASATVSSKGTHIGPSAASTTGPQASGKAGKKGGGNSTASASGQPIWALKGSTCKDLNFEKSGQSQWDRVDGDAVVANFSKTFTNNLAFCNDCLGLPVSKCKQAQKGNKDYNSNCDIGLSNVAHNRWDQAAAHFADYVGKGDMVCGIADGGCVGDPDCTAANGPGTYAILKSLQTMDTIVNNMYDAMDTARSACQTQMEQFSKDFAPPPKPLVPQWLSLLNSFIGLAGGLIGSVEGYAVAGAITAFSGAFTNGVLTDAQGTASQPADTGEIMGKIAQHTMDSVNHVATVLFQHGNMTLKKKAPDGAKQISLQDMMKKGSLMVAPSNPSDYKGQLANRYQQVLYQQTAAYTWTHLSNPKALPYIAFENGKCGHTNNALDKHIDSLDRTESNVEYNGNCYYLLGASMDSHTSCEFCAGCFTSWQCDGGDPLPGGTHQVLNGKAYNGLTVDDFVIPSVKGWENHGKKNGWKAAWDTGNPITNIQQTGMVQIPVCDYVNNPKNPGDGCPYLSGPKDFSSTDGSLCKTYKGGKPSGGSSSSSKGGSSSNGGASSSKGGASSSKVPSSSKGPSSSKAPSSSKGPSSSKAASSTKSASPSTTANPSKRSWGREKTRENRQWVRDLYGRC